MKTTRLRIAFLLTLMLSFNSFGNEEVVTEKVIREDDKVVYKKKTDLDFSDLMVTGGLMKPNGAYVKNRRKTSFKALIELRSNFRPELLESMSAL